MATGDSQIEDDPVLGPFLAVPEQEIETRPQTLGPVPQNLSRHEAALVEGVAVDLDHALPSDATARGRFRAVRPRR